MCSPIHSLIREKLRARVYHLLVMQCSRERSCEKSLYTNSDCMSFQTVALLSFTHRYLENAGLHQLSDRGVLMVSSLNSS